MRGLALATAATVIVIAVSPTMPIALSAMAVLGLTSIWFIASANTLAQLRCAPEPRGRGMSLWGVAMTGAAPSQGSPIAAVVRHVGPPAGFSVSGIVLGAAALAGASGLTLTGDGLVRWHPARVGWDG